MTEQTAWRATKKEKRFSLASGMRFEMSEMLGNLRFRPLNRHQGHHPIDRLERLEEGDVDETEKGGCSLSSVERKDTNDHHQSGIR